MEKRINHTHFSHIYIHTHTCIHSKKNYLKEHETEPTRRGRGDDNNIDKYYYYDYGNH